VGKIPVFDLLKSVGKVYTKIILDFSGTALKPIIKRKVALNSMLNSDYW